MFSQCCRNSTILSEFHEFACSRYVTDEKLWPKLGNNGQETADTGPHATCYPIGDQLRAVARRDKQLALQRSRIRDLEHGHDGVRDEQ